MMWQNMYCCIYKVLARVLGSDYALASSSGFPLHYAAEVFTGAPPWFLRHCTVSAADISAMVREVLGQLLPAMGAGGAGSEANSSTSRPPLTGVGVGEF